MAKLNFLDAGAQYFDAAKALENVAKKIGAIEETKTQIRTIARQQGMGGGSIGLDSPTPVWDKRREAKIDELANSLKKVYPGNGVDEIIYKVLHP
jgi:hypothetical protein